MDPLEEFFESYDECTECGGTGYSGHDCGEDTCCCIEPEDNMICIPCDGSGFVRVEE